MEDFDRRHTERLVINDAKILYNRKNGQNILAPLKDLTKSSVSFYIKHPLKIGEYLEMKIVIAHEEIINIKGLVTRISNPVEVKNKYAVVQFFAFGTDDRYNSLNSYEQLAKVLNELLQAVV